MREEKIRAACEAANCKYPDMEIMAEFKREVTPAVVIGLLDGLRHAKGIAAINDARANGAAETIHHLRSDNADLRARLAKYEDAEGRPVVTGDHPGLISALREMSNHVFNREHRLIVAAADALEYQAREIEVLEYSSRHNYECVQTLIDEKAALKAQPRGVVLPERISIAGHLTVDSSYRASGWNACLDEVARLNSPPVSAGDDRKLSDIGNELHNLSCHVVHHNEGWANQLGTLASELWNWQARAALTASAPNHGEQVLDSRSEFQREERYMVVKLSKLSDDFGDDELSREEQIYRLAHFGKALVECVVVESDWPEYGPTWAAIEARVTGSGTTNQLPGGWTAKPTDGGEGFIISSPRINGVASHFSVFPDSKDYASRALWKMLAAAPSAGSQKEQGE